jgi:hypothetical protein
MNSHDPPRPHMTITQPSEMHDLVRVCVLIISLKREVIWAPKILQVILLSKLVRMLVARVQFMAYFVQGSD